MRQEVGCSRALAILSHHRDHCLLLVIATIYEDVSAFLSKREDEILNRAVLELAWQRKELSVVKELVRVEKGVTLVDWIGRLVEVLEQDG